MINKESTHAEPKRIEDIKTLQTPKTDVIELQNLLGIKLHISDSLSKSISTNPPESY